MDAVSGRQILRLVSGPGFLRLFLAVVVVLAHFSNLHLGLWAVCMFFVLSGYWISVMYRNKYSKTRQPALTFLCSRYMRLLPVYLVCQAISIGLLHFESAGWFNRDLLRNPEWLARTLLIVSNSSQPLVLFPAWSLDIEMQFYLAAPLLLLALDRLRVWEGLLVTAVAGGVGLWWLREETLLTRYLMFFMTGIMIDRSRWRPSWRWAVGSIILLGIVLWVTIATPALRPLVIFPEGNPDEAVYWLSVLMALIAVPLAAYTLRQSTDALDRHAGNLAYSVYLTHPCVWMVRTYFKGFHTPFRMMITTWSWVLVIPCSVAVYALVDLPAERLRKRFLITRMREAQAIPGKGVSEAVGA